MLFMLLMLPLLLLRPTRRRCRGGQGRRAAPTGTRRVLGHLQGVVRDLAAAVVAGRLPRHTQEPLRSGQG